MQLDDVTILITTFYRPGYLEHALKGVRRSMPEAQVVVACDDGHYTNPDTYKGWTQWADMEFDVGLTPKRNAAVSLADTKYCLLGSDDFDYGKDAARAGVVKMKEVLEAHPEVDVVCGTYNGKRYEGSLTVKDGYVFQAQLQEGIEEPLFTEPYPAWKVDIGINYFLARTETLVEVPWDERIVPIGGEHGDWFLDMKTAGKTVVWIEGAEITSFQLDDPNARHPDYLKYRRRTHLGHRAMCEKWGVKDWMYL
jgi:hypothetical protein